MRHQNKSLFFILHKARKDKKGSALIEFALVVPIFLALIFTAFDTGFVMLKQSVVEHAAMKITREIYTGQTASAGMTREDILHSFCSNIDVIHKCRDEHGDLLGNITIELLALPAYSASVASAATCIDPDTAPADATLPVFSTISGNDIVYLRFCIMADTLMPSLDTLTFSGINLALAIPKTSNGKFALITSTVFRNEPF